MPRTMQQSIVRNRAIRMPSIGLEMELEIAMTPLMRREARPVTVMQPAMMPAMEQATATVMQPLPPAFKHRVFKTGIGRTALHARVVPKFVKEWGQQNAVAFSKAVWALRLFSRLWSKSVTSIRAKLAAIP